MKQKSLENFKEIKKDIPNLTFLEIVKKIGETQEQVDLYLDITRKMLKKGLVKNNYPKVDAEKIAKEKLTPKDEKITNIKNIKVDDIEECDGEHILYLKFEDQNDLQRYRHFHLNDIKLNEELDITLKNLLIKLVN